MTSSKLLFQTYPLLINCCNIQRDSSESLFSINREQHWIHPAVLFRLTFDMVFTISLQHIHYGIWAFGLVFFSTYWTVAHC